MEGSYESFWSTNLRLQVGSYVFEEDLAHLVNDLLMGVAGFSWLAVRLGLGRLQDDAQIGTLLASAIAAGVGAIILTAAAGTAPRRGCHRRGQVGT